MSPAGNSPTQPLAAGLWGSLAGALGGLCCLGPSAAILLGLGSSSVLFSLQLSRSLALGLAALLVAAGLAHAWRRGRACGRRGGAQLLAPALVLASFALSYGLLGMALPLVAAQAILPNDTSLAAPLASAGAPRRAILQLEKMDCPPCVAKVRAILAKQPDVLRSSVEPGADLVVIDYRPGSIAATELLQLMPSIYKAELISDAASPE